MSIFNLKDFMSLGMIAQGQNPVFKVKNVMTGQEFALKRMRRNDLKQHLTDFQEILMMAKLDHPNIMKIEGFSIQQSINGGFNVQYSLQILMKMLKGTLAQDITARVQKRQFYSKEEFKGLVKDLMDAAVHMQQRNIAHRDIKPENILFDENSRILYTDLSEAFFKNSMNEKCTTLAGSPLYLAPELKQSYEEGGMNEISYDPWKSDVYSLALVFLDMAGLQLHGSGDSDDRIEEIEEIYGKELSEVLKLMLQRSPESRPDFVTLRKSAPVRQYFGELEIETGNEGKPEKLASEKSLAQELLELFELQKKNKNDKSILKRIREIAVKIKEMETVTASLRKQNESPYYQPSQDKRGQEQQHQEEQELQQQQAGQDTQTTNVQQKSEPVSSEPGTRIPNINRRNYALRHSNKDLRELSSTEFVQKKIKHSLSFASVY